MGMRGFHMRREDVEFEDAISELRGFIERRLSNEADKRETERLIDTIAGLYWTMSKKQEVETGTLPVDTDVWRLH